MKFITRFWNWVRDETSGERTLYLNGVIAEETWWGDEVTPQLFKGELLAGKGDITVWIHSPGGDVFAAAQIYNMLMDYPGNVTVKMLTKANISDPQANRQEDEVQLAPADP